MAYITGSLGIERVIRPNAVEELFRLGPEDGGKAVIFDLQGGLRQEGLREFIKECLQAQTPLRLEANGALKPPVELEARFAFYTEFYGLSRWSLLGIEILQTSDEKKGDSKEDTGDKQEMKKLEPPSLETRPLKKPAISRRLESRALNVIPASIVWIANSSAKPQGLASSQPAGPSTLANRLGMQRMGFNRPGLGKPSVGIRSIGLGR